MEWIPVREDIPRKDGDGNIACLCFDSHHGMIRVLSFNEYHHCWDDEHADDYYTDAVGGNVSHWMPLPPHPTVTQTKTT